MSSDRAKIVGAGLLVLVVVGCLSRAPSVEPAPPQNPALVELQVATMQVLLDSLAKRVSPQTRIWLVPRVSRDSVTGEVVPVPYGSAEITAIQDRFPNVRLADGQDRLFLCPPGVKVMMPGAGCPILEDGIIVRLGQVKVVGEQAWTSGGVIRSGVGVSGVYSVAEGVTLEFRKTEGGWRFQRFTSRWVT